VKKITLARDEFMTTAEVADAFRVDRNTVLRWARDGHIPSVRTPGGHRRYRRADVLAYMNDPEAGR
jgi:excisionase family DNA binding protein